MAKLLLLTALIAAALLVARSALAQGAPPPGPVIFSGAVTVGGALTPDDLRIVARIGDYETRPRATKDGRYDLLAVGPPDSDYLFRSVTFHLVDYDLQATETVLFVGGPTEAEQDLTFPTLPPLALVPSPTPSPTPSATSTAIVTPSPTAPAPGTVGQPPPAPVVYGGPALTGGAPAPDGLVIVARIGDYESRPQRTLNGRYDLLTVGPPGADYLYRTITFHMPEYGHQAAETDIFVGGPSERELTLTFPAVPTATPTAATAPAPTVTPSPRATPTAAAPSLTPRASPTPSPIPTRLPAPTATPAPHPTATPTPSPALRPSAEPAIASLTASVTQVAYGEEFTVMVELAPHGRGISAGQVVVRFPPDVFSVVSASPGRLLGDRPLVGARQVDEDAGTVGLAVARQGVTSVPSDPGALVTIRFLVRADVRPATYSISVDSIALSDEGFADVPVRYSDPISIRVGRVLRSDLNGDSVVDYRDLAILGAAYGAARDESGYDARADLNGDGLVDYRDLAILGAEYGDGA